MAKRLTIYIIILLLATTLGLIIKLDPGYILILYHHWTISMPLLIFITVIILAFTALYVLLRLINTIKKFPKRYHNWQKQRLFKKANEAFEKSLLKLAEGDFQTAETLLVQNAKNSHIPIIYYLCAAYAAHQRQDYNQQDEYLYKAYAANPNKEFTISLIQAKLLLDRKQFESALVLLNRFKTIATKHPFILSLLKDIYFQLNDWNNLLKILPALKKYKVIDSPTLNKLEIEIYKHLFIQENNVKMIKKIWKTLPKKRRKNPEILYAYGKKLMQFKKEEEIVTLISKYLREQWDENLVELFGSIKTSHPERQLKTAENWLKKHNQDAKLLLTLGHLAARFKHWAKAEEYLMASLNIHKTQEAYAILANVYEKTNNIDKALATYRRSITFAESMTYK